LADRHRQRKIKAGRAYEPPVCDALKRHLHPGAVALDVGANVGMLTIMMAQHVGPTGQVFAFEVRPDNGRRLIDNLRACQLLDRVNLTVAAVTDGATSTLNLYPGRHESQSEWNIVGHDADGQPTQSALTVTAIALDNHLPADLHIDVVKIDVEGAAAQVLAGMKRILNDSKPALIIECHSTDNWRACAALAEQGYQLFDLQQTPLDPNAPTGPSHLTAIHPEAYAHAAA
jgi:FkbM family methyltransferase